METEEERLAREALESQENGGISTNPPEISSEELVELRKKAEAYEAQKIRAEKAEAKLKEKPKPDNGTDSIDQIKLGKKLVDYSDDELDFVVGFAGSKKPEEVLKALENPYVQQGIQAQRAKVEKERLSLKPSSKQSDSDAPVSLEEALATSNDKEREEILKTTLGYTGVTGRKN